MCPRPKKPRKCRCRFEGGADLVFKPAAVPLRALETIPLFRDELESLDLCDVQGLTQEQAGERMGVSRGTVQRLLSAARRKTAEALTAGKALSIEAAPSVEP